MEDTGRRPPREVVFFGEKTIDMVKHTCWTFVGIIFLEIFWGWISGDIKLEEIRVYAYSFMQNVKIENEEKINI